MGADIYTRKQINAARTWGEDAQSLARGMASYGRGNKFNGYVYQISQFGTKKMQVNSYDWISNLNSAAIRNKVKL